MHEFERKLITEWRRLGLSRENATLVVAVSGGADSTALLLAVEELTRRKKINATFIAAHLNHDLRDQESDADAEFAERLATSFGFQIISEKRVVSRRGNLEQNARDARYEFLRQVADECDASAVLTGHTINDQAETLLMNLIRGSGIDGLAGMKSVSHETGDQPRIIRPLLAWAKRESTEAYCNFRGVDFRRDAMNEDPAFTRVRIRRELMPQLTQFNPKIVETLARSAELLRFEIEASACSGEIEDSPATVPLAKLSDADFFRIIRGWLRSRRGHLRGLSLKHFEAVRRLVNSRKSGRVVELPGGETVIKKEGRLLFSRSDERD